jgi:TRAP-type uncharacterized transport system fused permease subunit
LLLTPFKVFMSDTAMTPTDERPETPIWRAIFWVAIVFSSFQLLTAAFSPLSSQVVRAIHVGFVLLMVFLPAVSTVGRMSAGKPWACAGLGAGADRLCLQPVPLGTLRPT